MNQSLIRHIECVGFFSTLLSVLALAAVVGGPHRISVGLRFVTDGRDLERYQQFEGEQPDAGKNKLKSKEAGKVVRMASYQFLLQRLMVDYSHGI